MTDEQNKQLEVKPIPKKFRTAILGLTACHIISYDTQNHAIFCYGTEYNTLPPDLLGRSLSPVQHTLDRDASGLPNVMHQHKRVRGLNGQALNRACSLSFLLRMPYDHMCV